MKQTIIYTFIALTIITSSITAGNEYSPMLSSIYDFYAINPLSSKATGRGNTGIATTENLPSCIQNPASLKIQKNWELTLEYGYKDNIALSWFSQDINLNSETPIYMIGTGINLFKILHTGIIFSTSRTFQQNYGDIDVTGIANDEENLDVIGFSNFYVNHFVNSITIPIAVELSSFLRLGTNINYHHYKNKANIEGILNYTESNLDEKIISIKYGIIFTPISFFSIGATYEPEYKINTNIIPQKLGLGLKLQINPISIFADCNFTDSSVTQPYLIPNDQDGYAEILIKDLQDRYDFHLGIDLQITNWLTLRTGLFTRKDIRKESFKTRIAQGLNENADTVDDQLFITNGITLKLDTLVLNISFMDSISGPKGKLKQSYLNAGLSIGL
jgi:hypothetical protein